jgi:hypothetical protein
VQWSTSRTESNEWPYEYKAKERLVDWEAIAKVDLSANAAFSDNVLYIPRLNYIDTEMVI